MGAQSAGSGERPGARWSACLAAAVLAAFALLAFAPPALATFHEMSIREVYPGGANNASYVELQMWAAGQNFVGTHRLVAYNADGSLNDDFALPGNVAGGANQATILIADSEYFPHFDEKPAPDASDANLNLSPAGGAVCWIEGSPPDCVAWGDFTGPLPTHVPELKVGSPASPSGVTAGKALRRSIAAGCSTLLDPPPTDDSDNSSADFSEQEPNPRDNATTPVEKACPLLPNTAITALPSNPADPTKSTAASFSFTASPAEGASFECKLDGEPAYAPCTPPKTYSGLSEGNRVFEVRAVNSAGADPTPALYKWRIDLTAPTATILTMPPNPSPGNSAAFTYSSSETGSTFQCSLEPTGEPDVFSSCPATGKTYPDAEHPGPLADGEWTFRVAATDKAGNLGTADEVSWEVDNSLVDKTPPETTLESRPSDPSDSPIAAFTYSSNEPGSTFQCELDGSGFNPCSASGISYTGLDSGAHSFQVRAIDPSNNIDPSPAGYSFTVVPASSPPALPTLAGGPLPKPAPGTKISAKPSSRTHDRTPTFRFGSSSAGATFQCKLDRGPFRACRSPFTTKVLPFGRHLLAVRAVLDGIADPSPATFVFRVTRP